MLRPSSHQIPRAVPALLVAGAVIAVPIAALTPAAGAVPTAGAAPQNPFSRRALNLRLSIRRAAS